MYRGSFLSYYATLKVSVFSIPFIFLSGVKITLVPVIAVAFT